RYGEAAAEPIADAVRAVVTDQATIAVIGDLDAGTARTSVPLLDAAGILHVSPGTASTTFANPSGQPTFFSLAPTAAAQAAALPRPVRVEAEGSEAAQNLAAAVGGDKRARTTFYAGYDAFNAAGVADALRRDGQRVILSADFASADLSGRYPTLTNLADPPADFAAAFADAYPGRTADAWAYRGWTAMHRVLEAVDGAGAKARDRQAVIDAYAAEPPFDPPVRVAP
ncbi:MAG: hypothetical protein QOF76_5493, partial [Solirubrobacteraceae bacterium]|nr:hypothetical protein [Solirubrobacteraceae bacterium]